MSDFVEWNPKRHGQKPPYWEPGMPTSVDGLNFSHQPNWAWIAGSTYYVPREAVELPRIEPEPAQTDELVKRLRDEDEGGWVAGLCNQAADRIEALTTENEQLRDVAMDAHDALISARAFILKKHGTKNPHRDETIEKLRTLLGDPPNDLAALEKQP